jgi:hypothetical protein
MAMTSLPVDMPVGVTAPTEVTLGVTSAAVAGLPRPWSSPRRSVLGFSATPAAGPVLVVIGMALGPHGLAVISAPILSTLDPAVATALAALGVLVGLNVSGHQSRRLLAGSSLEAAVTLLTVSAGVLLVHALSSASAPTPWLLAVMLGICAAPSATVATMSTDARHGPPSRPGDLDAVLPIVLGGLALAAAQPRSAPALAALVAQSVVIALILGVAAWLLITETSSDSERRVFALGTVLLLGGAAAHLSTSSLFAGLVVGLFWNTTGSLACEGIARDIRNVQRPLIVLLSLAAGARFAFSIDLAGLTVAYVVLRIGGKLIGGWLTSRVVETTLPRDVGFSLLTPGLVGIASALMVLQTAGAPDGVTAFTIVLAGSLGSELVALGLSRRGEST